MLRTQIPYYDDIRNDGDNALAETGTSGSPPAKFEDPAYQTCYAYWLRLKGSRWAPTWKEWDWSEIPSNLIPYFVVVDVSYEPLKFTYRFWGTANAQMHGIEMTNKTTSDIRSALTAKNTLDQYRRVIDSAAAMGSIYEMQTIDFHTPHAQTALRMPMSNDGAQVDHIVSFIDWRNRRKQIRAEHVQVYGA